MSECQALSDSLKVEKTTGLAAQNVNYDVLHKLMCCLWPCFAWHFFNLRSLHMKTTLKSKSSTLKLWQSALKIVLQLHRTLVDLLKSGVNKVELCVHRNQ